MDEQDDRPAIHCLRNILDDEIMEKYNHISEIHIIHTANIVAGMSSCIRHLDENESEPEPPPYSLAPRSELGYNSL